MLTLLLDLVEPPFSSIDLLRMGMLGGDFFVTVFWEIGYSIVVFQFLDVLFLARPEKDSWRYPPLSVVKSSLN
jgi:hypothetical protein